jgi:hypothetical protein
MQKLATFFMMPVFSDVTARYYSYPGSYFDRQLHKFTKSMTEYDPLRDEAAELRQYHVPRLHHEESFLRYLSDKWDLLGWKEKLQGYAVNPSREDLVRQGQVNPGSTGAKS